MVKSSGAGRTLVVTEQRNKILEKYRTPKLTKKRLKDSTKVFELDRPTENITDTCSWFKRPTSHRLGFIRDMIKGPREEHEGKGKGWRWCYCPPPCGGPSNTYEIEYWDWLNKQDLWTQLVFDLVHRLKDKPRWEFTRLKSRTVKGMKYEVWGQVPDHMPRNQAAAFFNQAMSLVEEPGPLEFCVRGIINKQKQRVRELAERKMAEQRELEERRVEEKHGERQADTTL